MELTNVTPLTPNLSVGLSIDYEGAKLAALTAKATFNIAPNGHIDLESQDPLPIFMEDEQTPLGVLPTDLPVRPGPDFEVMVLGAAYAPGGRPVSELTVTLTVGQYSKSIRVVGDRRWVDGPNGAYLTEPLPFVRMPLVWERAFGGTAEVWLDERSSTFVMHALNARGRGFDPSRAVENLPNVIYAAPTFPRCNYERWAPNLEDPAAPILDPRDEPDPICFAPAPLDSGLQLREVAKEITKPPEQRPPLANLARRAHPDWVLPRAPLGELVELTHCRPDGDFRFVFPAIVPKMDYVLGGRSGTRELTPQQLVLLPEERRFYVVYRHFFLMRADPGDERSIRLRYE